MNKIAIVEIAGSHDECILSQVMALKNANCYVVFCGTKEMFQGNVLFENFFDEFHEVKLPRTMLGDFWCMRALNKWFAKNNILKVVLNTAQGGHIRNLCLTSGKKIEFYGIIHTIKQLQGSFTQNIISRKVKHYFLLNDQLVLNLGKVKGLNIHSFYPIDYPSFDLNLEKAPEEIWITILGGVETRRKDLAGFIDFALTTNDNVRFIFLGKSDANHQDVVTFKSMLNEKNLNSKVKLFDDFVNQELFDGYLKLSDGILPLVHPNTRSAEDYFCNRISGAINVAFSYKIPMMIHESYNHWEDFQAGVVFYSQQNMSEQFRIFCDDFHQLNQELKQNPKFKNETQHQNFVKVLFNG